MSLRRSLAFVGLLGALFAASAIITTAVASAHGDDHAKSRAFSFALWGDMPYAKSGDEAKIPALLADMNADRSLAFSVYDGDIKDGSSPCVDSVYTDAIARFNALRAPAVYVPGDNEWTDCHRTNNGGYNNLERLDQLRSVMFASPTSFGQRRMWLEHQGTLGSTYAENTRWVLNNVVFVGLNVPGSNNNKVNSEQECTSKSARTLADCDADNAEYQARNAADLAWVEQSFERARRMGAKGVLITMQADPGFDLPETEDVDERTAPGHDGYDELVATLQAETRAFAGQVVLVHGDTHFFKVDKPLVSQADLIPNFTRIETFGSPNVDWVRVRVDPDSRNVFSVEPMVVPAA